MDNQNNVPICPNCHQPYPIGAWPICQDETGKHGHVPSHGGNAITAIHPSERAVVLHDPKTGRYVTPPVDGPINPIYAKQGFQRVELDSPAAIKKYERSTGRVHELSHWHKGADGEDRAAKAMAAPEDDTSKPVMSADTKRKLIAAIS